MFIERVAVAICLITSLTATAIIGQTVPTLMPSATEETEQTITEQSWTVPTVAKVEETTQETTEVVTEPPTIPETTVAETEPSYTADELEMLALVIYQEAGGDACSDETRLMVGTVVMNRVADNRFPNTIYEVLTQETQYGALHWTGLVWPDRANNPNEARAVERAYECAERILLGERVLPSDVVWQAKFIQGTEVVAYQDGMYFCR